MYKYKTIWLLILIFKEKSVWNIIGFEGEVFIFVDYIFLLLFNHETPRL